MNNDLLKELLLIARIAAKEEGTISPDDSNEEAHFDYLIQEAMLEAEKVTDEKDEKVEYIDPVVTEKGNQFIDI
ncbi:hypothetical protein CHL76_03940 [Marinococcus halophilus]|uniref:Uncharacterized protein n=1 Tax=Marinococcus halophilus TaxID=1371 RepID=A0A510Y9F8_MARHA|nr:hypothetical protein [Marinococcus halophilus]OZT80940.1 hypothetical protein CHL76_03940 [Marinococcus halophilus]GEK59321.1 hypothetical protein MHA01_22260 [Marinococcus halophilus]